jgi:hypothetical protein
VGQHERHPGDRSPGPSVLEHALHARIGQVERFGGEQPDHEDVQGRGDIELLLFEQPVANQRPLDVGSRLRRRRAGAGSFEREAAEHQTLPGRVARQAAVALEPPRRRRTGLDARLLGMGQEVRLEDQRQLGVHGLDHLDGRRQRGDGAIGRSGPRQPCGEQPDRCGQEVRIPERSHSFGEVLQRLGGGDALLGRSELEEHRAPGRLWWRFTQRPTEPGDRCRGRPSRQRIGGHGAQQLHPGRVASRLRRCELGRDPFRGGPAVEEHLGRTGVRLRPLSGSDVRVDGLTDDRVGEVEGLPGLQDLEGGQQVGCSRSALVIDPREPGGLVGPGAVAEHGDGAHHGGGGRGRPGQTEQDGVGDGGGADATHPDRFPGVRLDVLLDHLVQQRLEEEGVAPGGGPTGGSEVRRDRSTEAVLVQGRHGVGAERARSQDGRLGTGRETGHVGDDVPRRPGRGEDDQRKTVEPGRQVVEELQRLGIGPLEVVDHHGHRGLVGEVVDQPVEAVQPRVRSIDR